MPPQLPQFVTVQDVFKALCKSDTFVISQIKLGKIKGMKIGGTWRIPVTALEDYCRCPVRVPKRDVVADRALSAALLEVAEKMPVGWRARLERARNAE